MLSGPEPPCIIAARVPFEPDSVGRLAPAAAFAAAALTLLLLATWHWWDHAVASIPIPPSVPALPGGKPLLGHVLQLLANFHRLHHWLLEQSRRMGYKTFALTLPFLPTSFVVTDPACLHHVLKTRMDNYEKGRTFRVKFEPLLGHGIFNSDGQHWIWQRKLAATMFNVHSFKQYIDEVFSAKIEALHAVLLGAARSGRATNTLLGAAAAARGPGRAIDLHDLMHRFTLDTFAQLGFGVDTGCLTGQGKVPFAAAFDRAQAITISRFWFPAWPLVELLTGQRREIRRCSAAVKRFALDVIQQHRSKQEAAAAAAAAAVPGQVRSGAGAEQQDGSGKPVGCDLLSLFVAASGPDGQPLNDQQLVDVVINFIIAGRDTTAQALSWTFFLLMQHPEVEQQLLAEADEVLGGKERSAAAPVLKPSYDQIRRLRYARACFLEALRLYPSVPADVKYAVDQDVLPDGSVIPKGAQVIYPPFVVNRMPSYWGEDADSFRPERWLHLEQLPSPYQYLSFNAGPRICLGQRLAELEGVFVLVSLVSRFRFRPAVPLGGVTYALSTTLPMKAGLQVMVEERV